MSCLICLRVIHDDDDTAQNSIQKMSISTLCKLKLLAPINKSEFDDDDETCNLCTDCYPLFARMEEIKTQISLLEEEILSKVGQIQATIFHTATQLENYGDNDERQKITQIRAMLLRVAGANAEPHDENCMSDEVQVKIEHDDPADADDVDPLGDVVDQFACDDNFASQGISVEKISDEEMDGQNTDDDVDSAFCITPTILKRPKSTAKVMTRTLGTKRKREDSPSSEEEESNIIWTPSSPRIETALTAPPTGVELEETFSPNPSIEKKSSLTSSSDEDTSSDDDDNDSTPKIEPDADISKPSDDNQTDIVYTYDITRPHKCTFCLKYFPTEVMVSGHIKHYHSVVCTVPLCPARFSNIKSRNDHLKQTHDGLTPYQCQICKKRFLFEGKLAAHKVMRHEEGEKKFFCAKCGKGFCLEDNYARHVKLHEVEGIKPLVCDVCDDRFENEARLQRHLKTLTHFNPFECSFCPKRCISKTALERHLHTHSKEKREKCPHCDYTVGDKVTLERHIARAHTAGPSTHICPHCGKGYYHRYDLTDHVRERHVDGPPRPAPMRQCDLCGETFSAFSTFQAHLVKEHGGDPFVCDQCGARLVSKAGLDRHKQIHEGDKKHKCQTCGVCFVRKIELAAHMGTHRTERPFPCPHCARAFKTGGRLGQHVRDSHTPGYVIPTHKCPQCRKEFRFRNKLDAHIRAIHTGERPFTCDQCGKGFVINSALRLHLRGAHGVALESKDRLRRSKKRVVQRGDEEVTT